MTNIELSIKAGELTAAILQLEITPGISKGNLFKLKQDNQPPSVSASTFRDEKNPPPASPSPAGKRQTEAA